MREHRAFTLTELLLVAALLAVLVSILVPALSSVQRSATAAKCLTNIRNLQTAHWLYMGDHHWHFIDAGFSHGGVESNEELAWVNSLQEFYDDALVLRSPADDSPHWPAQLGGQGVPVAAGDHPFRRTSYGLNNFLTPSFGPGTEPDEPYDRLTKVPHPAATVHFLMMAETGEFAASDHTHVENWIVPGAIHATPEQAASQIATSAHGGSARSWDSRANYGFLDGHVETLAFRQTFLDWDHNRFNPAKAAAMARLLSAE